MYPEQAPLHPGAGLVEMDGRGLLHQLLRDLEEQLEGPAGVGDRRDERPDRDRHAEHVGEHLGHALVGEVLVDREVAGKGPDSSSVAGGRDRLWRRGCLLLVAAATSSALETNLGHIGTDPWELEDLAGLDAELAASKVRPGSLAAPGAVHEDLAGIVDPGGVCSLRPGLLAGLALCHPALLAVQNR